MKNLKPWNERLKLICLTLIFFGETREETNVFYFNFSFVLLKAKRDQSILHKYDLHSSKLFPWLIAINSRSSKFVIYLTEILNQTRTNLQNVCNEFYFLEDGNVTLKISWITDKAYYFIEKKNYRCLRIFASESLYKENQSFF